MIAKKDTYKRSLYVLGLSFWLLLIIIATPTVVTGDIYLGFIVFSCVFTFIVCPISYMLAKVSPK